MKSYYHFKSRRKKHCGTSAFSAKSVTLRLYVTLFKGKPVAAQALFSHTTTSEYKDLTLSKIRG